jgi:hypothetical protein
MRFIISIACIFLIKVAGSPLYGQYNNSVLAIKSYVKSIDSLWLLDEEEDVKNITKTGVILVRNTTDTLYITTLKSVLGDTVYRMDYHSTTDRDESYYLNDNKVVLAKQELNNSNGHFQKLVFFENGAPATEDMVVNNKTLGSKEISISEFINEFKNYKDFATYKKEQLTNIAKKHFPDLLIILSNYSYFNINFYANGDSLQEYYSDLPSIIHEGYHNYVNSLNKTSGSFHYMLNDTLTISIDKFDHFPSNLIAAIGKGKLKNEGRFNLYVNTDKNELITQQRGLFGLLEEYSAYFQELKACTVSYYYLKANYSFDNTSVWINYLAKMGSNIYAVNEFKIFISWYLQYAKLNKPAVFQKIIQDQGIKQLYSYIEREYDKLIKAYLANRTTIIDSVQLIFGKSEEYRKKEFEKHLSGINIYIENLNYSNKLLKEPEHKILNLLRY